MTGKQGNLAAPLEESGGPAGPAAGLPVPLLSLATSLCASYPWLLWLGVSFSTGGWSRPILSYPAVIALSAAGLFMNRFFNKRPWPLGLIRAAILSGGFAIVALVWVLECGVFSGGGPALPLADLFNLRQPYLFALLASLLFWRQGLAWGSPQIYYGNLYASFGRGLAALVLLVLLLSWQVPRIGLPGLLSLQESAAAYLAAFFLLGLAALSLSTHQAYTGDNATRKTLRRNFNRRWLILLAAVLGAIFIGGGFLTGAVSAELWPLLLNFLAPVGKFFGTVFYYLMIPFSYIAEWVVDLLKSLMREQLVPPDDEVILPSPTIFFWEDTGLRTLSPGALAVLHWFLFILLLGAVAYFIARSIRARTGSLDDAPEEFHESFFSWSLLKKDLLQLRSRIRPPSGAGFRARAAMKRFLPGGGFRSMRELYRALLTEASRRGLERFSPETPYEYGNRLRREVPAAAGELHEITGRYVAERYGQRRYTPRELANSAAGWRKIKAALKESTGEN